MNSRRQMSQVLTVISTFGTYNVASFRKRSMTIHPQLRKYVHSHSVLIFRLVDTYDHTLALVGKYFSVFRGNV